MPAVILSNYGISSIFGIPEVWNFYCTSIQSVRNITARLLDAMTGKRWLAYSTDSSRVYRFDIDFYCSEFRHARLCLVISLCLSIIYREIGRNLPVREDVVFTLRRLEPLSDRCSFREIKILGKVRIGCLFWGISISKGCPKARKKTENRQCGGHDYCWNGTALVQGIIREIDCRDQFSTNGRI